MSTGLPAGTYTLKNISTGTVLDSYYGKPDEGNAVNGYQSHGGNTQKWKLEWSSNGTTFRLSNVQSGTYLAWKNFTNGVAVKTSKTPQLWRIVVADKGYVIEPADHPGYALDITESNSANETPAILYNYNATDNQKWVFVK